MTDEEIVERVREQLAANGAEREVIDLVIKYPGTRGIRGVAIALGIPGVQLEPHERTRD